MKASFGISGALALVFLTACSSSPTVVSADGQSAPSVASTEPDGQVADDTGLGPIVYSGQARASCERRVRTGTRIPRDICHADGFNGMFPSGGLNMGTAGEGQPGYGGVTQ